MVSLTEIIQQLLHTSQIDSEILASLVIFAVVALVGWAVYGIFSKHLIRLTEKTETKLDDVILSSIKTVIVISIMILGIEYALSPLSVLEPYNDVLTGVFMVLQIFLGAYAATRVSSILIDWYTEKKDADGKNSHHLMFILKKVIQLVVYIFAFLIILYVFKVDLTGVVVGLGVGGIAIAFALQSTLSDFFSAFSIYFDRPFEIDDFIVVGEYSGFVKSIGVKSTRIKLLQGEELIISNKELTSTSVRNFRKLEKRRISFTIGVTYDTSLEKLKKIPTIITDIIKSIDTAQFDRVHFTEYGDYSLKFVTVYYVNSPVYTVYLDTQQKINYAIKEAFEREGIQIAFPTSTVYVKN
ncbi:MAG: mechanosensitive ion channel family protein [Candidatus Bathyarchaeota archaeon]|nr:mechanosensitive ion channel family protein [Candidatus Bathyarchaeota archaeon]